MELLLIVGAVLAGVVLLRKSQSVPSSALAPSPAATAPVSPESAPGAVSTAVASTFAAAFGPSVAGTAAKYTPPPQTQLDVATGTSIGGTLGGGATSIAAAMGKIGPLTATIIGAAITAVVLICRLIFRGADPNQVPASRIEQTYEVAADQICALWYNGMLDSESCISLMQGMLNGMAQAEQEAPQYVKDPRPFQAGVKNAREKSIGPMIQGVQTRTKAQAVYQLTLASAKQAFQVFDTTPGHWYAQSVTQGNQIAMQVVNNLIAQNYGAGLPTWNGKRLIY